MSGKCVASPVVFVDSNSPYGDLLFPHEGSREGGGVSKQNNGWVITASVT